MPCSTHALLQQAYRTAALVLPVNGQPWELMLYAWN